MPRQLETRTARTEAVMVGVNQVENLPAEDTVSYSAPLLDLASRGVLATGVARICENEDAGMSRARVTVLLTEPYELE